MIIFDGGHLATGINHCTLLWKRSEQARWRILVPAGRLVCSVPPIIEVSGERVGEDGRRHRRWRVGRGRGNTSAAARAARRWRQ